MKIRGINQGDIAALTEIVRKNYDRRVAESFNAEVLSAFAQYPYRPCFYVAEGNSKILGCAGYVASWIGYGTYTLCWVNVDVDIQRNGVGTALVARCLRDIASMGTLVVLGTSLPKFYEKWGFRQAGVYDSINDTGKVVMILDLQRSAAE